MDKARLTKIIELFVVKEKQNRFLEFISSANGYDGLPKRYRSFLLELLNDPRNLKPSCIVEDLGGSGSSPEISRKLRKLGAGKEAYLSVLTRTLTASQANLKKSFHLSAAVEKSFIVWEQS